MKRLHQAQLKELSSSVRTPRYSRDEHKIGIVHFGIGAFHRGHQAVFTEDALEASGGHWRISAVSLRSAKVSEQMMPQDGLYTVVERGPELTKSRIVGAVAEVLVAPENPDAVLARLADPEIAIVTLTVTEKGYHFNTVEHCLDLESNDIIHDRAHPERPRSMPGFLVAGLARRKAAGERGLTIISCDNLPENGEIVKAGVVSLARIHDAELAEWIEHNVRFCSSMVDRIVPAVTDEVRAQCVETLGYRDEALVVTEPFKQWVIEDNFLGGRPAWEKVGVDIVPDVSVYERLKLRTLNGSHSTLAYTGRLCGYDFIHEAVQDPILLSFTRNLMRRETGATLSPPKGFDLASYQERVIERFSNAHIPYGTLQVATDGSQKLLQRLLLPAQELLANDVEPHHIYAVVACWMRCLSGKDDHGTHFSVNDPQGTLLSDIAHQHHDDSEAMLTALDQDAHIFPKMLIEDTRFRGGVVTALNILRSEGTKSLLNQLLSD